MTRRDGDLWRELERELGSVGSPVVTATNAALDQLVDHRVIQYRWVRISLKLTPIEFRILKDMAEAAETKLNVFVVALKAKHCFLGSGDFSAYLRRCILLYKTAE